MEPQAVVEDIQPAAFLWHSRCYAMQEARNSLYERVYQRWNGASYSPSHLTQGSDGKQEAY